MTEDKDKLHPSDLARAHEIFERKNLSRESRRIRIKDADGKTHSFKLQEAHNYLERQK